MVERVNRGSLVSSVAGGVRHGASKLWGKFGRWRVAFGKTAVGQRLGLDAEHNLNKFLKRIDKRYRDISSDVSHLKADIRSYISMDDRNASKDSILGDINSQLRRIYTLKWELSPQNDHDLKELDADIAFNAKLRSLVKAVSAQSNVQTEAAGSGGSERKSLCDRVILSSTVYSVINSGVEPGSEGDYAEAMTARIAQEFFAKWDFDGCLVDLNGVTSIVDAIEKLENEGFQMGDLRLDADGGDMLIWYMARSRDDQNRVNPTQLNNLTSALNDLRKKVIASGPKIAESEDQAEQFPVAEPVDMEETVGDLPLAAEVRDEAMTGEVYARA